MFGRGSPVLDYWLGHSVGFELTSPSGGHRGVVQEVVTDERGYPRALVVRGGMLQRARVVSVDVVEAVVPADGTMTIRGSGPSRTRPRFAPAASVPARRGIAGLAAAAAATLRLLANTALLALSLFVSAAAWSVRHLRQNVPALARRAGRAGASTIVWMRPHARTLARTAGATAVTLALLLFALAHALAAAVAAYARFVAQEWTRRRSGRAPDRVTAERR